MTGTHYFAIARILVSRLLLFCLLVATASCGGGGDGGASGSETNPSSAVLATHSDSYSVVTGQVLTVSAPGVLQNDIMETGSNTTLTGAAQPMHGSLTIYRDGSFTYQPVAGYSGSDTFTYTVADANGNSSTATVTITVSAAPALSCSENLASCFDHSSIKMAKYLDNKSAAAAYTFDDGGVTSMNIASVFEGLSLRASFYIIPSYITDWSVWKNLAGAGHEIGNHSMDHKLLSDSTLSDSELDNEINGAQKMIEQNTGVRPLIFVFPYDSYDTRSFQVASSNHVASRVPGFSDDSGYRVFSLHSATTTDSANGALNSALSSGGWFVAAGHGMGDSGWEPVNTQVLQDHLKYASRLTNLWIDTFLNIARYRLCSKNITPKVAITGPSQLVLKLDGDYSSSLCTSPVTIAVPLFEVPRGNLYVKSTNNRSVSITQSGKLVLVNAIPGDEVLLWVDAGV